MELKGKYVRPSSILEQSLGIHYMELKVMPVETLAIPPAPRIHYMELKEQSRRRQTQESLLAVNPLHGVERENRRHEVARASASESITWS